ncbi:hypothetical protein BaRGS_00023536 [Batillaria attramentaria]|uniref:Uncharacterized protein n=1 Tax=Batillaria attramentaria TaxID=370345 RepID=A0ABD0KEC1_9CAEN
MTQRVRVVAKHVGRCRSPSTRATPRQMNPESEVPCGRMKLELCARRRHEMCAKFVCMMAERCLRDVRDQHPDLLFCLFSFSRPQGGDLEKAGHRESERKLEGSLGAEGGGGGLP